eukprot:4311982-Amphidinium_carterae.1
MSYLSWKQVESVLYLRDSVLTEDSMLSRPKQTPTNLARAAVVHQTTKRTNPPTGESTQVVYLEMQT